MNRLRLRGGGAASLPPDPPTGADIVANSAWTGTFKSGFTGTGGALAEPTPTAWDVTTPTAILVHQFKNYYTFGEDFWITFSAKAYEAQIGGQGISKVRIMVEGNYVDVTAPSWRAYLDKDGETRQVFGYHACLKHAENLALSATGSLAIYAEAYSITPGVANRVVGPLMAHCRAAGVGVNKQFDREFTLDPKGTVVTGSSYQTQLQVLNYCTANSIQRPLITMTREYNPADATTRYKAIPGPAIGGSVGTGGLTVERDVAETHFTFRNAPGVNVVIGDDTLDSGRPYCDGLVYQAVDGGSIKIETCRSGCNQGQIYYAENGSNALFILDGVELTGGTPVTTGWSGTGAQVLKYGEQPGFAYLSGAHTGPSNFQFFDVYLHDMPSYGLIGLRSALNCTVIDVSGSGIENMTNVALQGIVLARCDGIHPGFREYRNAFNSPLTYTGSASVVEFEKTSANGQAGYIRAWEDGVKTHEYLLTQPSVAGPTTTQLSAVRTEINTNWTNFSVGTVNSDARLSAMFLSLANLDSPANSISRAKGTFVGGSLNLQVIADVHANGLVFNFETVTFANIHVEFLTMFDQVGAGNISAYTMNNAYIGNVVTQDLSRAWSSASISLGSLTPQQSVVSGDCKHFIMENITLLGEANAIVAGSVFTVDALSKFQNFYANAMSWRNHASVLTQPDRIKVLTGSVPVNSTNSSVLTGQSEATCFADPTASPPNCTPLSPLLLNGGTGVVGARAVTGTDENQGWNLAA